MPLTLSRFCSVVALAGAVSLFAADKTKAGRGAGRDRSLRRGAACHRVPRPQHV